MATAFGPGIRALSVYNTNDGTTIQIDGADISPESTIEESKTTRTSAKGNVSKLMTVWELNVQFADPSGFSSLNSADSQTREWQVVAAGVNGKNLQWYEDSTFIVENSIETDPAADSNFPYTLRMRHISESPAIYNNVNLLAYLGWEDADSDNIADGYTISQAINPDFTSSIQSIEGSGSLPAFYTEIRFPINNINVTTSINFTAVTSGENLRITGFNYSGTQILSVIEAISTTGVRSAIASLPANIYVVRLPIFTTISPGSVVSFKYPALTTNGTLTPGTEFLNY